jgi:MFS family permease
MYHVPVFPGLSSILMVDRPASSRSSVGLLTLLTALNVLNFVDRQLISSLAPLLIADLSLTRAQIGLLVGYAFVVLYTLVGLALGAAADRLPRLCVIGWGLALWSAMTALSGAARGFAQLAAARVLVGVGEAALTPAALGVLGDAFPPRRLAFVTGVYYAGIPLGTAASLLLAGWVAPRFGWRACFYALGVLGLAAVALLALVGDPPRRGGRAETFSWRAAAAELKALLGRRELVLVMLGGSALVYASAAALHSVTWLVQERGMPFATAAYRAGFMAAAGGFVGNVVGGWVADQCHRRMRAGRLVCLACFPLFFAPWSVAFLLTPPDTARFYLFWFVSGTSFTAYFGPLFAAAQELAPPRTRSTALALTLLVTNLLGVGPGPWITGLIGDHASLTAGLLVSVGVSVCGCLPLAIAARRVAGAGPPSARV